jgi:glycosyltransferase involved in cell wall biosynthesis
MNQNISVLLPVKNAELTLARSISSTLNALGPHDELLIMLDGCTDGSKSIAASFSDSRIRVFENEKSKGVANSLNSLLAESRFDLIGRMDADDICFPWRFVVQKRMMRQKDADFVFSTHFLFGKSLRPVVRPSFWTSLTDPESRLALTVSNPFIHPGVLMKRRVMQELGGYRECPAEDYDLWLSAALEGFTIYRNWLPGVAIRTHQTQITQSTLWNRNLHLDSELAKKLSDLRGSCLGSQAFEVGSIDLPANSKLVEELKRRISLTRWPVRSALLRNLRKVVTEN